jgi:hypothetical protein
LSVKFLKGIKIRSDETADLGEAGCLPGHAAKKPKIAMRPTRATGTAREEEAPLVE